MVSTTHHHHATKRKNEDDDLSSAAAPNGTSTTFHHRPPTTAVVYSPRNGNSSSATSINWNHCQSRLRTLLQQYDTDPIMDDIATISTLSIKQTVFDEPQSSKLQQANNIVNIMEAEIQQIMTQVQNVSTVVSSLQQQYDTLRECYETSQCDMNDLQQQQQRHATQIQHYQSTIQQLEMETDQNQQNMYQTVPKLQQSLSLYGNMTGIKWKYDDGDDDDGCCDGNEEGKVYLTGEIVSILSFGISM